MKLINIFKQILKENELNQKYDYIIGGFNEFGLAQVILTNKWNYINTKGKLISDIWFDNVYNFNEYGTAKVELNNKYNFINTEGKLISDIWFDWVYFFNEYGLAKVELNNKNYFINTKCEILFKNLVEKGYNFVPVTEHKVIIKNNDKTFKLLKLQ